jgi:hypothetical protein
MKKEVKIILKCSADDDFYCNQKCIQFNVADDMWAPALFLCPHLEILFERKKDDLMYYKQINTPLDI